MEVTKHVFREYDVRGIAETELTNEFAEQLGKERCNAIAGVVSSSASV